MKTEHPQPTTKKARFNMWQNSAFMIKLAWQIKEKKVLVFSVLIAIFGVAQQVVNLYLTPVILGIVESHAPLSELLVSICIFVGLLLLISATSAYLETNALFGRVTVRSELIFMLNNKSATTSYPNIDDKDFQNLLQKAQDVVTSNRSAGEAIWTTLTDLLKNLLGFSIYTYLLTSLEPFLLLFILATTVCGYFVNQYLSGYEYRHRDEEAVYLKKIKYLTYHPTENASAKDIRIFGLKNWLTELFEKNMQLYSDFHKKAEGIYLWSRILDLILSLLRNGIAYVFLISLILAGNISVAEFLLFFTAVDGFTTWVNGILSGFNDLHRQCLDISTFRECLAYPEPFLFENGESLTYDKTTDYELTLENVSFRYPNAECDTLSGIHLTLHTGEKLAIVGLNGAGKTTLIKILCGFLDPTEGRVLLNGEDIRKYNRRDYYKLFSAVFQNFTLIASTISANVAQSEDDIDLNRVKDCIEKAGLTQKIMSFPKGLDTLLDRDIYEDAVMLSGGETQKLMLARAIYKDAPFIILDEPTSALDPIAEAEMYQKYNSITKDKSSIYISHRLASTRFCDRIILIEDAKISEEGTHESLMQLGGKYAELYSVQSEYYKKGGDNNGES